MEFVARVEDLPEGEMVGVQLSSGSRICLANVGGRIVAMGDNCTHQDFPMSDGVVLPDGTIECAWHGARFDPNTGAAVRPPAVDALPLYEVAVRDGAIYVGGRATGERPTP
jgi:nitrite reductase/ring-hydroxylating ferredoxin subunit